MLGLTFPCLAYVKLRRTPTHRPSTVGQRKAIAWFIIGVSTLLIPACLTMTIINMATRPAPRP